MNFCFFLSSSLFFLGKFPSFLYFVHLCNPARIFRRMPVIAKHHFLYVFKSLRFVRLCCALRTRFIKPYRNDCFLWFLMPLVKRIFKQHLIIRLIDQSALIIQQRRPLKHHLVIQLISDCKLPCILLQPPAPSLFHTFLPFV